MLNKLPLLIWLLLAPAVLAQDIVVTDDVTTDTRWMAANQYVLDGLVFVEAGATLTIDAGTVVKARSAGEITTGDGATALIVRPGARILAEGTVDAPIVFTSTADDLLDPNDLRPTDRGLWGGVVVLGRATNNQPGGTDRIEGIPDGENAVYGGTADADDSGILRYVSIRHGGFSISGVSGDEINGLTLGSVGSGTTIEYVEVYANLDDCFEWFGGTVSARYLVGAFCGDDTFDYDQGWRGKGQFWFSIQSGDVAGRAGEHDGGDDAGDDAEPLSNPTITNATYIGAGIAATPSNDDGGSPALKIRDAAAGKYLNSIFVDFPGSGIDVEDKDGVDSRARMEAGDLMLSSNLWWGFGAGADLASIAPQSFVQTHLQANGNQVADPQITVGTGRNALSLELDPRPAAEALVRDAAADFDGVLDDAFFMPVDYVGAFDPAGGLWTDLWSALYWNEHTVETSTRVDPVEGGELPRSIVLEANYPNPFNPATTIEFGLDRAQHVRLAVYDLLGREVAVLADGMQPAGTFRVGFDAGDLSSGMYVYRLQGADGTALTRTMLLLK